MKPPRIVEVSSPAARASGLVDSAPPMVGKGDVSFLVLEAGMFNGRWYERGEVLRCCAAEQHPGQVVLVAFSRGRPVLGEFDGRSFRGDRGEACSPSRWWSAGRVTEIWRLRGGAWCMVLTPTEESAVSQAATRDDWDRPPLSVVAGKFRRAIQGTRKIGGAQLPLFSGLPALQAA